MKLNGKNITFLPQKQKIEKNWWLIDADGQVVGKLASRISTILRGKDHPFYTPFMDCGDFVVVINARKLRLTGTKEESKMYYRHSGYMGGLREISFKQMQQKHPDRVLMLAVRNMLPKNRLSNKLLTKLKIFADAQHPHQAQKPQVIKL